MNRLPTRLLSYTLTIFMVTIAACERRAVHLSATDEAQLERAPERTVTGVDFTISENGVPRVRIRAPRMAEYEGGDSTYLLLTAGSDSLNTRVRVTVFDAHGDTSATIRSNRLYYYEEGDQYEAEGKVVVLAGDERRLESEHLAWDEPSETMRTPGFARITTPDEQIQGYELVADEDLSSYRLARVTGQVTVRE